MERVFKSPFGDENIQDVSSFLNDSKKREIEYFSGCRIDLIRSNMWKCYSPWYVTRRILMNDYMLVVFDGALRVVSPQGSRVLEKGDFFISAPGEYHEFGFTGDLSYVEHLLIHFRVTFPNHPFRRNLFKSPFLNLPANTDEWLNRIKILAFLWCDKSNSARFYAESLLKSLFVEICLSTDYGVAPQVPLDERVSDGIRFIQDHFSSEVSIKDIATKVELSEPHFRKLFREQTGRAPLDFLTETRLQQACVLLQNSNLRIREIAEKCGFNNEDYFCRLFKNNFRQTPTEYRKGDLSI